MDFLPNTSRKNTWPFAKLAHEYFCSQLNALSNGNAQTGLHTGGAPTDGPRRRAITRANLLAGISSLDCRRSC
jgi:hypothetical protein